MRLAAFLFLLFAALAFGQGERYQATGTVVAIDRELERATIDTEAIDALKLPALGLAFVVYDRKLLERLHTGRRVEFEFVKQGRNFVLVRVVKTLP